jgi:hypothetical protein
MYFSLANIRKGGSEKMAIVLKDAMRCLILFSKMKVSNFRESLTKN